FVKNTERIEDFAGKRAYRIPDQLDHANKIIGEVKNVARLDYRSQLKNDLTYAEKYGYTFRLYVRSSVALS
ncbi:MAG TPA: putative toxin, partial [Acidobacteriaceae bacterium]